jgi:hypothetical protein
MLHTKHILENVKNSFIHQVILKEHVERNGLTNVICTVIPTKQSIVRRRGCLVEISLLEYILLVTFSQPST